MPQHEYSFGSQNTPLRHNATFQNRIWYALTNMSVHRLQHFSRHFALFHVPLGHFTANGLTILPVHIFFNMPPNRITGYSFKYLAQSAVANKNCYGFVSL